jgi:hypothetical protein
MLAIVGVILEVIAAVLKLVGKHGDWVIWLIILGAILIGCEVAWGWRRSGYYRGPA